MIEEKEKPLKNLNPECVHNFFLSHVSEESKKMNPLKSISSGRRRA
jgi:hypothetical protein